MPSSQDSEFGSLCQGTALRHHVFLLPGGSVDGIRLFRERVDRSVRRYLVNLLNSEPAPPAIEGMRMDLMLAAEGRAAQSACCLLFHDSRRCADRSSRVINLPLFKIS